MRKIIALMITLFATSAAAQNASMCAQSENVSYCVNEIRFCGSDHYDAAECAKIQRIEAESAIKKNAQFCIAAAADVTNANICQQAFKNCAEPYYARRTAPWSTSDRAAANAEFNNCLANNSRFQVRTH